MMMTTPRERLQQTRVENEVRTQSFEMREKEFEASARKRELAVADSRDHVLPTLRILESERVTLRAREVSIPALVSQVEENRRQHLATVIVPLRELSAGTERQPRRTRTPRRALDL
jgi:hypothetical protein